MDNTINPETTNEIGPDGTSHHTRQMETDTVTEEREVLLQRAMAVNTVTEARAIRDQIYEHKKMYKADAGVAALDEQLKRLETMLGE
ncbi:MAG: hypothetical protein H8F28_11050 [Fibrella sp.]|nr:hypothetical protein [Armatimonadota bacterium]